MIHPEVKWNDTTEHQAHLIQAQAPHIYRHTESTRPQPNRHTMPQQDIWHLARNGCSTWFWYVVFLPHRPFSAICPLVCLCSWPQPLSTTSRPAPRAQGKLASFFAVFVFVSTALQRSFYSFVFFRWLKINGFYCVKACNFDVILSTGAFSTLRRFIGRPMSSDIHTAARSAVSLDRVFSCIMTGGGGGHLRYRVSYLIGGGGMVEVLAFWRVLNRFWVAWSVILTFFRCD